MLSLQVLTLLGPKTEQDSHANKENIKEKKVNFKLTQSENRIKITYKINTFFYIFKRYLNVSSQTFFL